MPMRLHDDAHGQCEHECPGRFASEELDAGEHPNAETRATASHQ